MATRQSALCGDIDHLTAGAFRDELYLSISQSDAPIVAIDLAGVTFMDSAGFRAVMDANTYAVRTDHLLIIRNPSASCTRLIGLCDQRNELLLVDDTAEMTANAVA
jgi:anti-anti-sigma factor